MEELVPLVIRAQCGDLDAYGVIVRRFQDMAYGYSYSILGDFHRAEDAAQEAFIQAYRDICDLREPAAFAGWFRQIVFRHCTRLTRGKKLTVIPLDSATDVASSEPGPDAIYEKRKTKEQVLAAVRSLPENERIVTTLFYIGGYLHNDIAGFLEVPLSTIKSRLHTSRKRLKERMLEMVTDSLHENALPEEFTSRVISNVPALAWGQSKECTFAGSLESALSVTNCPFDYATIMGATGLAFRVRWFQGPNQIRWCPSSPVGEFPDEIAAAARAIGWNLQPKTFGDFTSYLGKPGADVFAPDIVNSINSDKPVLCYDDQLNVAVITGYEDGGRTVLMKDYFRADQVIHKQTAELHGFFVFFAEQFDPLSPRAALSESLKTAITNWRRTDKPSWHTLGFYLYGDEALAQWASDIGLYDSLTDEHRNTLFFVSWWTFGSMMDARMAAIRYLQNSVKMLGKDAGEALSRAAALYQQEISLFEQTLEQRNAFLGPWTGKSIGDWTPETRKLEQSILLKLKDIETAAITEIELALRLSRLLTSP